MVKPVLLHLLPLLLSLFSGVNCKNVSSRPAIVNIGAMFALNSTIGRVAKIAIDAAVDDVNSDPSVLHATKLVVQMQDSNCSAYIGIVQAMKLMEKEIVAIVGPQSSVIAHVMSPVSNEFQVPLLSFAATDPTLSSLQYPFFVRTTQSDLFQMEAVAELVDYYQWRLVIAIYTDDDYGRNGIASLGDKLAERGCKISYNAPFSPTADRTDISDLLLKVLMMESRVIVVHANFFSGLTVFSVAQSLQMMGPGYVWIATAWLASLLDSMSPLDHETMNTMQGVLAFRQHTPDSKAKGSLISRWKKLAEKEKDGNLHLNAYGLYAYDTVWVFARAMDSFLNDGRAISFSSDPRLNDNAKGEIFDQGKLLLDKIRHVNLTGVTGQVQFDSDGYLIHPAYDIINIIGTGLRTVGYWSKYSGLSTVIPEKLYTKPANRSRANQRLLGVIWPGQTSTQPRGWVFPNNGKKLRIGVPNRVSYRQVVSQQSTTGMMSGFCIDVFFAAVNRLPYAVPYQFVSFGDGHKNPNYSQLVHMVASEEFDAAIGDITITTNRAKVVDFTQPFTESGLVVLASTKKHKLDSWAFLQPFGVGMWFTTVVAFVIVGVVIWVLEHKENKHFRGSPKKQLVTTFWFSFSTMFFAQKENTVSTLGRIVLIIWLFVVLIIQSSYTASLTSILTVQQLSSPIKGIDSLLSNNQPIGFQVGSFAENFMVNELGISKSRLKELGTPEEYLRSLNLGPDNGGVAAIVDERPYVELFLSSHCNFAIVGSEFTKGGWGFAFPRDSPLAVDMSTAILSLSETGELQRIHDVWLMNNYCSSEENQIDSDRLHLTSFLGLFLICGIACILSLLIHFILILRKFLRHLPPTMPESSAQPISRLGQSFKSVKAFLSFADEREEDDTSKSKSMRKRSQTQKTASESCDE